MYKLVNGIKVLMTEEEEKSFLNLSKKSKKPLEELKQEKIQELRKKANDYILSQYPYYKQLNIIRIGIEEEKNNMSSFIDEVRNKVNQLELDINSCNTKEELSTINYNIYDNNK